MNLRTSCLLALTAFALPAIISAATVNIGFKPSAINPPATSVYETDTWNNLTQQIISTPRSLVDSTGASSGISVTLDTALKYTYVAQNFNGLPEQVASDFIFGHDGAPANPTFTFSGLSAGYTYSFSVYAVRLDKTDIRSGLYTATGANTKSGVLDASGNTSNVLVLSNVTPDANGSITFSMMKANTNNSADAGQAGYFQLNGLVIEATPSSIPEPSTVTVFLGLGALACVVIQRRRV